MRRTEALDWSSQDQMVTFCAYIVQDVPLVWESSMIEKQMTVTDATDVNETFLGQLAHAGSLSQFGEQCAPRKLGNGRSFIEPLEPGFVEICTTQFNQIGCCGTVASVGRPPQETSRLCEGCDEGNPGGAPPSLHADSELGS